jgi:hypothetical protein
MTNKFYVPNEPKISIAGPKIAPEQQESVENGITPRSHTPGTISDWITEPQSRSASGPQMARKCVFCAQMLASLSRKCVSSDAQVARRCTQVTQPALILASVSYMYRRCIAGVSQVYHNPFATLSQVDKYVRK